MSTDRPTLTDYCDSPDPAPGQEGADATAWTPAEPHCRHCGATIKREHGRVVGDNEGCVQRCARCTDGVHSTVAAARMARGDGMRVAPVGRRGGTQG